MVDQGIQLNAVAFREGDAWIIQGIEYDIVAHTDDPTRLVHAFARAVAENLAISGHLGRGPLQGVRKAPVHFRDMFEKAMSEMRPVHKSKNLPDIAIRLAA